MDGLEPTQPKAKADNTTKHADRLERARRLLEHVRYGDAEDPDYCIHEAEATLDNVARELREESA